MFYWSCSSAKTDSQGHACYPRMTTLIGRVFILLVSACAGLVVNHFYSCPSYKFLQACVHGWLQKQQNERFSKPHLIQIMPHIWMGKEVFNPDIISV